MYTLGLNLNHADSSCALFHNGELISATEEERFKRLKHWAGIPIEAIEFCLNSNNLTIKDIHSICIGRDPSAKLKKKIFYSLRNFSSVSYSLKNKFSNFNQLNNLEKTIFEIFGYSPKIYNIEHHRAHLASSYYSSPFGEATLVSIDGAGDFTTLMIGRAKDNKIEVLKSQDFPVSLGLFYTAFTQYLGFPYYGDEYKVMGLAPYGDGSVYINELRKIIWTSNSQKNLLEWDESFFNLKNGVVNYVNNIPDVETLFSKKKFETVFGINRTKGGELTQEHKDLAASVQLRVEEVIFEILAKAFAITSIKNLCLSGGVAQNSVANGKILRNTPFEDLYIPSAGHDAGIAMGAAQFHLHNNLNISRGEAVYNASLGIQFNNQEIEEILKDRNLKYRFMEDEELLTTVAKAIASEKVIGFFNGRAEFGPRALGNRSILADPRNKNAQKLLNEKIKKRESFRPFAPSILEEFGSDYFEDYQYSPFMERVLKIKKEKRDKIPAVTHVDGTGRLQTVSKVISPRYYTLIEKFYEITGIPILINTSFNENEPVVNAPLEAIETFERTDLDILVLENYILEK